jgi:hypothetical protein
MNTTTRISTTERLGHRLGRGWRAYARGERRVAAWLASHGLPAVGATVLLWIIKLGALAALLYAALWLVLPLAVVVAIAWGARNADWEEQDAEQSIGEVEWRVGPEGPGLYGGSGCTSYRID